MLGVPAAARERTGRSTDQDFHTPQETAEPRTQLPFQGKHAARYLRALIVFTCDGHRRPAN